MQSYADWCGQMHVQGNFGLVGAVATCSPICWVPDVKTLSARERPEAAENSIMAAPGRMERPATMWSHRKETAGESSLPTSLQNNEDGHQKGL